MPGEFWSSLDGRLKPGLQIVVSLPLEIFSWVPAGPPVTSVSVQPQRRAHRQASAPPGGASTADGQSTGQAQAGEGKADQMAEAGALLRRRRSSGTLTMEGRPASSSPPGSDNGDVQAENEGP